MAVLQEKETTSPAATGTVPVTVEPNYTLSTATSHTANSHHSHGDEEDPADGDKYYEDGDDIYGTFSVGRKRAMLAILGFGAWVSMMASTCVLPAVPEITETFNTQHTVVEISNAIYIGLLGVGCVVWGPMSQIYGRRPVRFLLSVFPHVSKRCE